MTTLIERIKADSIAARKAKAPTSGVLVALLGEISTKEKSFIPARPITEAEVLAIVKKMIGGIDETLAALRQHARTDDIAKAEAEKVVLEVYMPKQMTDDEVRAVARERKAAGDDMGKIMAHLKANHAGMYDGKTASALVKEVLAG